MVKMDESFFAPSNQNVHSNPSSLTNAAANDNDDDDDWGDFIINNSGGLAHTLSLPRISSIDDHPLKLKNENSSEPPNQNQQPGSAPGRVNSGLVQWEKPKGALPLSIFGLEEEEVVVVKEEEESGASTVSFGDYSNVKKQSGLIVNVNVNDLLVNLYNNNNNKQSDLLSNGDKTNSQVTHTNGTKEVKLILDCDPLNFNSITKYEGDPVANGNDDDDDDDDDGWEFKDAETKAPVVVEEGISMTNQMENVDRLTSNCHGVNFSNLDFNGWNNINVNGVISSTTNSSMKGTEGPADGNIDSLDDDDGWEFKAADSKLQVGDDKRGGQLIAGHMPVLNFDGSRSSWDVFFSDSSGVKNSNEKHFNGNLIDEKKNSDVADEWVFKGIEPELQVLDHGSSKINTENWPATNSDWTNSSWNASSFSGSMNPNSNGMNLDMKQVNLSLFDENVDLGVNDGWEFRTVETEPKPRDGNTKDNGRMSQNFDESIHTIGFGNGIQVPGDLFSASQGTSQKLGESDFNFDFNSTDKSKENDTESVLHFSSINGKVGFVENLWAFKDAFSEIASNNKEEPRVGEDSPAVEASVNDGKVQENNAENHKGALPLSIFGDEEKETHDSDIYQDISIQMPTSSQRDSIKSPHVDMSINDLLSNLYSQAQQNDSVNHAQKNGLDSPKPATISDPTIAIHNLDDDSWEFQDAFTGAEVEDQNTVLALGESNTSFSAKGELNDFEQFFSKLKEKLQCVTLSHFENLKKARSAAALAGEDANIQALDKEIQDLDNELHQDSIFSNEVHSDSVSPGDACLNVFIEVLREPQFQVLELEYQLIKKLSLAESNLRSAIELLKYVTLTLQILTSVSKEVQLNYVSAWFKMLYVCAQELRHGASIWKQSLDVSVHDQILSKPQGKNYFLALGEIYRVVEVLGCSSKLYKPWILASSTDTISTLTLLSECFSLWSSSGLEEALRSILNSADFEADGHLKTLLESIKYIHDLDAYTLYNHVFSGQGPTCQLSALTAGTVPGMKTVVWNGDHCFIPLANLWGNLISSDPPNLPCIHVG